jgi:cysteine desulfuration protein SufE
MKTIQDIEQEIVEEFKKLPDVDAKYSHLFHLAQEIPEMPLALKNEDNRVRGCQSDLWFHLSSDAGKLHLIAESDSLVIKGIASMLIRLVEGRKAEDIEQISLDFVDTLEIWKLPSERNNGLLAMLDHIKTRANQIINESSQTDEDQQK